jgi:ankyrin repeat protein
MSIADKLFEAFAKGDEQSVKELLGKGADPNAKDSSGWTPLHTTVAHGHASVAKLLIEMEVMETLKLQMAGRLCISLLRLECHYWLCYC